MTDTHGRRGLVTAEQQREIDLRTLELRFGELYRIWWDNGIWRAKHDATGDELEAPGPTFLAIALGDHLAEHRERLRSAGGPGQDHGDSLQATEQQSAEHGGSPIQPG